MAERTTYYPCVCVCACTGYIHNRAKRVCAGSNSLELVETSLTTTALNLHRIRTIFAFGYIGSYLTGEILISTGAKCTDTYTWRVYTAHHQQQTHTHTQARALDIFPPTTPFSMFGATCGRVYVCLGKWGKCSTLSVDCEDVPGLEGERNK